MTFKQLSILFQSWGWQVLPNYYERFEYYLKQMLERNRVIIIWNNMDIEAVICFFITNDYESLYKKGTWDLPQDEPNGNQIYIDKIVCKEFTLQLRRHLQDRFEEMFPWANEAHYHRAPYDRHVRIKRRAKDGNKVYC